MIKAVVRIRNLYPHLDFFLNAFVSLLETAKQADDAPLIKVIRESIGALAKERQYNQCSRDKGGGLSTTPSGGTVPCQLTPLADQTRLLERIRLFRFIARRLEHWLNDCPSPSENMVNEGCEIIDCWLRVCPLSKVALGQRRSMAAAKALSNLCLTCSSRISSYQLGIMYTILYLDAIVTEIFYLSPELKWKVTTSCMNHPDFLSLYGLAVSLTRWAEFTVLCN